MLERFTFLEVPEAEAERVVELVSGTELGGRPARVELAGKT